MLALGIYGRPRRRIDLDQRDLGAAFLELEEPLRVLLDLLERRLLVPEGGEQTLNHHRPLPPDQEDIREDLGYRNIGPVDAVDVRLRAAIQFGPNFVASGEVLQTVLYLGQVQPGGIRNQHQLERKTAERANVNDCLQGLRKMR